MMENCITQVTPRVPPPTPSLPTVANSNTNSNTSSANEYTCSTTTKGTLLPSSSSSSSSTSSVSSVSSSVSLTTHQNPPHPTSQSFTNQSTVTRPSVDEQAQLCKERQLHTRQQPVTLESMLTSDTANTNSASHTPSPASIPSIVDAQESQTSPLTTPTTTVSPLPFKIAGKVDKSEELPVGSDLQHRQNSSSLSLSIDIDTADKSPLKKLIKNDTLNQNHINHSSETSIKQLNLAQSQELAFGTVRPNLDLSNLYRKSSAKFIETSAFYGSSDSSSTSLSAMLSPEVVTNLTLLDSGLKNPESMIENLNKISIHHQDAEVSIADATDCLRQVGGKVDWYHRKQVFCPHLMTPDDAIQIAGMHQKILYEEIPFLELKNRLKMDTNCDFPRELEGRFLQVCGLFIELKNRIQDLINSMSDELIDAAGSSP